MDINITLIWEMVVFALFVWVTMKFIWPPMMRAMEERKKKIADGLAAAAQGKRELELAQQKSAHALQETKQQASVIVEQSNARAAQIIEDAKTRGEQEGKRIITNAQTEIDQQIHRARTELCAEMSAIVIAGAEKILAKSIDASVHAKMLDDLIAEIK